MTVWTPVEPISDEPAPKADYWPTFSIGDRVRVIWRPECPECDAIDTDQLAGRVVSITARPIVPEHVYGVDCSLDPHLTGPGPVWCCAAELEPLP